MRWFPSRKINDLSLLGIYRLLTQVINFLPMVFFSYPCWFSSVTFFFFLLEPSLTKATNYATSADLCFPFPFQSLPNVLLILISKFFSLYNPRTFLPRWPTFLCLIYQFPINLFLFSCRFWSVYLPFILIICSSSKRKKNLLNFLRLIQLSLLCIDFIPHSHSQDHTHHHYLPVIVLSLLTYFSIILFLCNHFSETFCLH